VDVGHGGEADGLAIVASASHLFYVGNCARLGVSGGLGMWNAPGGDFEEHLNAGSAVSFLLNPCPRATTVHMIPLRLMGGIGVAVVDGQEIFNIPLGVGIGFRHPGLPVGRLEPWVTPRVHYREYPEGDSEWDFAFSAGVTIGLGGVVGARLALDCCEGGVGGGYGFSKWF
jgi:hypothetical protein